MALEYVIIGQPAAALRPVEVALALAPSSRFVVRSAARYFLHIGDVQRAHDVVVGSDAAGRDPWILASEIAIADVAGRISRYAKRGRALVDAANVAPASISELAGALATLEYESGNRKRMRRLFGRALEYPNENAVAQAVWVARQDRDPNLIPSTALERTPNNFEANAWTSLVHGEWRRAAELAWLWLGDEPFSSRPAVFGSWVASGPLVDFEYAARFCKTGLAVDPDNTSLLNNLAFSLARSGDIEGARAAFDRLSAGPRPGFSPTVFAATGGLIEFHAGRPAEGRRLYDEALRTAMERDVPLECVCVLMHYAREVQKHDTLLSAQLVRRAEGFYPRLATWQAMFCRSLYEPAS